MDKILVPKLGKSYVSFKKELLLWQDVTSLEEDKRAAAIVLSLPDRAKQVALQIPRTELKSGANREVNGETKKISGVERLTEELDKIYMEDVEKERYQAYAEFRNFSRGTSMSVHEYLLEFDKRVKTLKEYKIELPESVLAYELLNSANLSSEQIALARATVDKLDYKSMCDQIKKITIDKHPSETLPEDFKIKVEKESDQTLFADTTEEAEEKTCTFYGRGSRGNSYRGNFNRSRGSYRHYPSRTRNSGYYRNYPTNRRGKKTNPVDQYGNPMVCNVCKSIYHFALNCPDKDSSSTFYQETEDVVLFQNAPTNDNSPQTMKNFTRENFDMAVLDTGCNVSVCGKGWLDAYIDGLSQKDKESIKTESNKINFRFGDNPTNPSNVKMTIPAVINDKDVMIQTQVVEADIPLLLSKNAMQKANMVIDMGNDTVTAYGVTKPLHYTESGHCSIKLNNNSVDDSCLCSTTNCVLFSEGTKEDIEKLAVKLHKQFAHPPAEKLKSFVKTGGETRKEVFDAIEKVSMSCDICRRYKRPEKRPIVCLPLAKNFNDTIAMDLKCFDAKKNLFFHHIIDHATRFSSSKVIKSKDKEVIVESIFTHWISIFGVPKKALTDNGGEYVNKSYSDLCEKLGVHIATTGAEAPWSNGIVERHHDLLSRNVTKIMEDNPDCSLDTALAWAVHAKNCLSNVNGFSPYQLVFGYNPNIPSLEDKADKLSALEDKTVSEKVAEHINAIYSARREQIKSEAAEKIRRALAHQVRDVYSKDLNQGDLVYYKRDNEKRWRGPGTVIGTDKKIIFVRHGGTFVRCHRCQVVQVNDIYKRDYKQSMAECETVSEHQDEEFHNVQDRMLEDVTAEESQSSQLSDRTLNETEHHIPEDEESFTATKSSHKQQSLISAKASCENKSLQIVLEKQDIFAKEKEEELRKWIQNDVYEEVDIQDLQDKDVYPISVTWVTTDKGYKRKARLVARGFLDEILDETKTVSPTCRKESLRILFTVIASMNWQLKSLDIASAFLQGKPIDREVYLVPPKEHKKKNVFWKLKKCVYGLSDAARQWYEIVKETILEAQIEICPHDDSFFYWFKDGHIEGIMTIHVDDFIYGGTSDFEELLKTSIFSKFTVGQMSENQFVYLGLNVVQNEDLSISVYQDDYVKSLKAIEIAPKRKLQKTYALSTGEYKQYRSICGQILWLAIQTRPDVSYDICVLSNYLSDPNVQNMVSLNKLVRKLHNSPGICLTFSRIVSIQQTWKIISYSDASYNSLPKNGSQCGYIIFISDSNHLVKNPVAWKSIKIERKCQSSLEAECLALLKAVDHALFVQKTLQNLYQSAKSEIVCHVDNKSLNDLLLGLKDPTEKRLICSMAPIKQMISKQEVNVKLIRTKEMPADILTKHGVDGRNIRECFD